MVKRADARIKVEDQNPGLTQGDTPETAAEQNNDIVSEQDQEQRLAPEQTMQDAQQVREGERGS